MTTAYRRLNGLPDVTPPAPRPNNDPGGFKLKSKPIGGSSTGRVERKQARSLPCVKSFSADDYTQERADALLDAFDGVMAELPEQIDEDQAGKALEAALKDAWTEGATADELAEAVLRKLRFSVSFE